MSSCFSVIMNSSDSLLSDQIDSLSFWRLMMVVIFWLWVGPMNSFFWCIVARIREVEFIDIFRGDDPTLDIFSSSMAYCKNFPDFMSRADRRFVLGRFFRWFLLRYRSIILWCFFRISLSRHCSEAWPPNPQILHSSFNLSVCFSYKTLCLFSKNI